MTQQCSREGGESDKPYVFKHEDFTTLFESEEGSIKVTKKFHETSQLLSVIQKYRALILEANPLTFLTSCHFDSDIIFFVGHGRGTITLIFENRRESFNIEKGHLMVIPASIIFYVINSDDNEKLILSMFLISIDNAGNFVPFFGFGGGDGAESFLHSFSSDILQTAFNTSEEIIEKHLCQKKKSLIMKATKEQIKALTAEEINGSKHSSSDFGPCQILSYVREVNECGELSMVDYTEYLKLQDFNMFISFCILTKGCMNNPFMSTRATKIIMVLKGRGRLEMVGPQSEDGSSQNKYRKIKAELIPGIVFVVPPGHPMVLMGSKDENLETICFEVNAKRNQKIAFAGQKSIFKNMHKEAKELVSGTSAEEVDNFVNSQQQDFFIRGPSQE